MEEKLLIGDRPKKSPEPEVQLPLRERLAIRKPEEAAEVGYYGRVVIHAHNLLVDG